MRAQVLSFFNTTATEYSVIFTSGTTNSLHIIGESFPWTKNSKYYYLSEVPIFSLPSLLSVPQLRDRTS